MSIIQTPEFVYIILFFFFTKITHFPINLSYLISLLEYPYMSLNRDTLYVCPCPSNILSFDRSAGTLYQTKYKIHWFLNSVIVNVIKILNTFTVSK